RELVALHGGRAWAEDGQSGTPPAGGRGVRFVIELPLEPSPQVAGQPGGLSSVPARCESWSWKTTPIWPPGCATTRRSTARQSACSTTAPRTLRQRGTAG